MSGHGDLENMIISAVERVLAGRRSERHGLVTSWDAKKHLGKVTYQPPGDQGPHESGWLQNETSHVGQGYGIAIGLQPGDGKKTGDQVIVRFQEGDFESGKIAQRVHSDRDTPPKAESGEIVIWTKFKKDENPGPDAADTGESKSHGQQIFFKNDSSLSQTDGSGAVVVMDGKGNITTSSV